MSKPAALFLTPETPYPAIGGGVLRAASVFEYLAQRYEVDVIVFCERGAPDPGAAFPPGMARSVSVVELPHNSRHSAAKITRNGLRLLRGVPPLLDRFSGHEAAVAGILRGHAYAVAVVEHFWLAPYLETIAPAARTTVLDLVDIESVLAERCSRVERWPVAIAHRVFHAAYRRLEHEWLPRYSALLAASADDARAIRDIAPQAHVAVYPNTIPYVGQPSPPEDHTIAFSGNLEYHPNISAVRHFRSAIWPTLHERWPGLTWRLIGKNPHGVAKSVAGDPHIECSGPVVDAIAELARARVVVVPVLAGSGTRVKILEAWAAGRAVVSTRLGAEGLPARDGANIVLADEAREFADAVTALLESPERRKAVGDAGRRTYETEGTWPSAWAKLELSGVCDP
jgi:glycosyltransferase involved in cell wall biosynthesis